MKNTKHTKGPWKVSCKFGGGTEIKDFTTITDSENRLFVGLASSEQDARLIAAAPEMLEAIATVYSLANLQTLLETKYSKALVSDLMKMMGDAIEKARGTT